MERWGQERKLEKAPWLNHWNNHLWVSFNKEMPRVMWAAGSMLSINFIKCFSARSISVCAREWWWTAGTKPGTASWAGITRNGQSASQNTLGRKHWKNWPFLLCALIVGCNYRKMYDSGITFPCNKWISKGRNWIKEVLVTLSYNCSFYITISVWGFSWILWKVLSVTCICVLRYQV